jgi:hypothetical protein
MWRRVLYRTALDVALIEYRAALNAAKEINSYNTFSKPNNETSTIDVLKNIQMAEIMLKYNGF